MSGTRILIVAAATFALSAPVGAQVAQTLPTPSLPTLPTPSLPTLPTPCLLYTSRCV